MTRKNAIRSKGLKTHLDSIMPNGYKVYCELYELGVSDSFIGRKFGRTHPAAAFWRIVHEEEQGKGRAEVEV